MVPETTTVDIPKVDTSISSLEENLQPTPKEVTVRETELIPSLHVRKNHPSSFIIRDPSARITTRKKDKVDYTKMIVDLCYTSSIEPTSVDETLKDEYWIHAMQEELLQFKRNNVWTLVPKPEEANIIEEVDFDETLAHVARVEAIHLLLSISFIRFIDPKFSQHVYKLNKALYGLKQAPRAWYDQFIAYLGRKGYTRGGTDKTLL
ncbi:putative mitochondrial protein [Cucumis melo var. makuwa]|uniref:Mitochondrial protein n=1 Tax=Cucumis melo var. makuwa TaxID=1194695 RepID=A0A5A7SZT0_CUCMM|nr:putative mitochondrial protein [Cucumis melo var. makuwa]TYJ95842.1 putative mitochondrial protein [Cucumis melo var. makuwa]